MIVNERPNFRLNTWVARLNRNMDGRSGVTNLAGHAWKHGIGLHVSLDREPSRPVSVLLDAEGIDAVRDLIAAYDRIRVEERA